MVVQKVKMGNKYTNTKPQVTTTVMLSVTMNKLNLLSAARTRKPHCVFHKRTSRHLSPKYKSLTRTNVVVFRVRLK